MYRQHAYEHNLDDDLDAYDDVEADDRDDGDDGDSSAHGDRLSHDELIEEARRVREEVDALVGMYKQAMGGSRPQRRRRRPRTPMASRRAARDLLDRDLLDMGHDDRRRKALLVMLLMELL